MKYDPNPPADPNVITKELRGEDEYEAPTRDEIARHESEQRHRHPEAAASGRLGTRRYWIGCDKDGPTTNYTLGGQSLPYRTESVIDNPSGTSSRYPIPGAIAWLDEDQVAAIIKAAHREIVRPHMGRLGIFDAARRNYQRRREDYPVGMHVYMVELSADEQRPDLSRGLPPRLIERVEDWQPPEREPDHEQAAQQAQSDYLADAIAKGIAEALGK